MTDRLSLTQERMRFLHNELHEVASGKELKQKLRGLPVALRTNGLGVLLAQLAASSDKNEKLAGGLLSRWLIEKYPPAGNAGQANIKNLLVRCLEATRMEYESLQHESMALLEQAKLIAEALWPGEE